MVGLDEEVKALAARIPAQTEKRSFARKIDRFASAYAAAAEQAGQPRTLAQLAALRLGNLLLLRHARFHRHTGVLGRPYHMLLDPSNTCQLKCPGCVHSPGAQEIAKNLSNGYLWPRGQMATSCYDQALSQFGPYLLTMGLYNYGEPLINRNFPEMVTRSKSLLHHTSVSSNISLSFDADAVVASGLNYMIMSVDGCSQETLSTYRRGARWELCYENMRRLVEAKNKHNSSIYLNWRFFTFEHNVHEVPKAIELAKQIGVGGIDIARPDSVDWDDPTIKVADSPLAGAHVFTYRDERGEPISASRLAGLAGNGDVIAELFFEGWERRLDRFGIAEEPSRAGGATCFWLYQNVTIDSARRIMPCCIAPQEKKHLVFGTLSGQGDHFNGRDFEMSRLAFADRPALNREIAGDSAVTWCAECPKVPSNLFSGPNIALCLRYLGVEQVLDHAAIDEAASVH